MNMNYRSLTLSILLGMIVHFAVALRSITSVARRNCGVTASGR